MTLIDELTAVIGRVGVHPDNVVVDGTDGWSPVEEVLAPGSGAVDTFIDLLASAYRTSDRTSAAMLAWRVYSHVCAQAVVGSWVAHRRIPDLGPGNAALRFTRSGGYPELAMITPRIFVADDAPEADLGHAVPMPVGQMGSRVFSIWWSEHMEVAVERWHDEGGLGRRGLTAFAVSQAATIAASAQTGDRLDRHAGIAAWTGVLPGTFRAMAPVVEQLNREVGWVPMPLHTACCLQYRVTSGDYCANCNLLSEGARTELLAKQGSKWRPIPVS